MVEFKQIDSIEMSESDEKYLLNLLKISPQRECCGILAGRISYNNTGLVSYFEPITNISNHFLNFEMAPLELSNALDKITDSGLDVLGTFHTHPGGLYPKPSQTDIDGCKMHIPMVIIGDSIGEDIDKPKIRAWDLKNVKPVEVPIHFNHIPPPIPVVLDKPKPIEPVDPISTLLKAVENNKVGVRLEITPEGLREIGDILFKVLGVLRGGGQSGVLFGNALSGAFNNTSATTFGANGITFSGMGTANPVLSAASGVPARGVQKTLDLDNTPEPQPHVHDFKPVLTRSDGKVLMECSVEDCNEQKLEDAKDDHSKDGTEGNTSGKDTVENPAP